jgi:protein TonB
LAGPSNPKTEDPALQPQPSQEMDAQHHPLPQASPEQIGGVAGGVPGGMAGGQLGGVWGGEPGGNVGGIVGGQVGGVVPPRFDAAYLQNPQPEYPTISQRLGEEGRVLLRVLVSPEGRAEQIELKQGSGFTRLDLAALAAVRRWRFQAARQGSESLAAWVLVPITFHLDA